MRKRKCSGCCCAFLLFAALGLAVSIVPSEAFAGGVYLGFGLGVPLPGPAVAPPPVVYPPPVVVEQAPPPPPVVVRRTPPAVVYEGPVVVEKRSTVYYYPPSYEARPPRDDFDRDSYRQRTRSWEDDEQY